MDKPIKDLVEAIDFSKGDFADVATQYNIEFSPGSENHDVEFDIAFRELEEAHKQFDSLSNSQPLRMDTGITSNEFLARLNSWNAANSRCHANRKNMMGRYRQVYRSLYGVEEHDSALGDAMRQLKRAHSYFKYTCNEVMDPISAMIQGLQLGLNANAVQLPVHPPAAEPVIANVSEEHNMAAIPESEEMVEGNSNTSASEDTVEDN